MRKRKRVEDLLGDPCHLGCVCLRTGCTGSLYRKSANGEYFCVIIGWIPAPTEVRTKDIMVQTREGGGGALEKITCRHVNLVFDRKSHDS